MKTKCDSYVSVDLMSCFDCPLQSFYFFFFFYVKVGIYISSTCVEKESGFHAQLILTLFKKYIKIFQCLDAFRFTRIILIKKKKKVRKYGASEYPFLQLHFVFVSQSSIWGSFVCNMWHWMLWKWVTPKTVWQKCGTEKLCWVWESVWSIFKKKYACNIL